MSSSTYPRVQYARDVATVKLSDAVKYALERYLARTGETRQQVLEQALRRYLRAHGEAIDVIEADEPETDEPEVDEAVDEVVDQRAVWLMLLEQQAHLASLQGQHPLALRMAAHACKALTSPRTVTRLLETINASPAVWSATLPSEHRTVTALAFSPDGRYLANLNSELICVRDVFYSHRQVNLYTSTVILHDRQVVLTKLTSWLVWLQLYVTTKETMS